jgi:hypothetical protein
MRFRLARVFVLLIIVGVFAPYAGALEVNAELGISTVSMAAINERIQFYADQYHESIAGIHSAANITLGATFGVSLLGVQPCVYGHGLFAGSTSGGGPIRVDALGFSAGGKYAIGPWVVKSDLGLYRGTFTFLQAGYNAVFGWGFGINGEVGYVVGLTSGFELALCVKLRWLTIGKMSDQFGTSYEDRGHPFFSMNGVGIGLALAWTVW